MLAALVLPRVRAAAQYNPARNTVFFPYARQAVENAIIDAIRKDRPDTTVRPLDEEHDEAQENDAPVSMNVVRIKKQLYSTYRTDPEHIYIQKERLEEVDSAVAALPARDRVWVNCRYGFDDDEYKSLTEMGRIYHLSENRANQTEKDAIRKLKKKLRA